MSVFLKEVVPKPSYVHQIESYVSRRREGEVRFHCTAEFAKSKTMLLTDVYVLNSWFLSMMQLTSSFYQCYFMSDKFHTRCTVTVEALLLAFYIWFTAAHRKPPDKATISSRFNHWFGLFSKTNLKDKVYECIIQLEEFASATLNIEVDILGTCFVLWALGYELLREYAETIVQIEHRDEVESQLISDWKLNPPRLYGSSKPCDRLAIRKETVTSNVVLSYTAQSMEQGEPQDEVLPIDSDCYQFAIDTCTTYHICKHKELFVGDISNCNGLFIQGIGGKTEVSGYGTIKVRLIDDDGIKHDLLISNTLYVPECPTNLICPQKWSQSCSNPLGTGEITVGATTLLFWDDKKFSKVVHHHPQMGIPIITVNDGYTKAKAFMSTSKFQPSVPCYLNTSTTVEDEDKTVHIIPVEDEEPVIERIQPEVNTVFQVDERSRQCSNHMQQEDVELVDSSPVAVIDDSAEQDTSAEGGEQLIPMPKNEVDIISESLDQGMTKHQRELLRIHYNLKHLPFSYLRKLAKRGVIPKYLEKVEPPLCTSCIMGKQHRKPWRGKGRKGSPIRKPQDNFAGAMTSTDQMISPYGGLIPQIKGRLMKAKFYAAQIKVDHHTDYTYVHLMRDTTAESTLEAKNAYERLMQTFGHKVLGYHADNGRFAEKVFVQDCKDKAQKLTFCGVGSHHQNGIAERRIKSISEDARTMLAHGNHHWPEVVTKSLWPYALKAAVRARNKYNLDENGLSPEEKVSGVKMKQTLKNEHPLFCPVYVLNSKLQGGVGGIPKWEPRSRAGVYLGHSSEHASDVALVLNLTTGLVSPQYHVIFDDAFTTVESLRTKKEPSNWEVLCKNHTEDFRMDALPRAEQTATELQAEVGDWLADEPTENENETDEQSFDGVVVDEMDVEFQPASQTENLDADQAQASEGDERQVRFDLSRNQVHGDDSRAAPTNSPAEVPTQSQGMRQRQPSIPLIGTRRSSRVAKPSEKLKNYAGNARLKQALGLFTMCLVGVIGMAENHYVSLKSTMSKHVNSYQERMTNYKEVVELNVDGSMNYLHPLSLISQPSNDTFYFHQAMQEDDRDEFIKAMVKELEDHRKHNHWKLIHRSEIGDAKTVKAIWSFKRKRRPDGSLLKHKARLNAHGGMQIYGETYWDTYAPVVNWISIRMMLTLSVIHQLYTTSIDFTLAFPQAEVETTIFMEVPLGCCVPEGDYVCLLLKNLYGLRQAAKTWFECLRDALIQSEDEGGLGFRQSKVDPCIFYKPGVLLISWVDDCLIFAKSKADADKLIQDLQSQFTLTEEEDVSAYLGVQMEIDKDENTVTMSQPYLIERIIKLLDSSITEANVKNTPAVYKEILHKDENGAERRQSWNYRSAIGMLNYLAASTRPDITFAVHQCARFAADPKLSHERALKRIVRYLKGTKDKGIVLRPNTEEGIACYVDADFAGGYSNETKDHPISVYSRTGCPSSSQRLASLLLKLNTLL